MGALGAAWFGFDRARVAQEQTQIADAKSAEADKQRDIAQQNAAEAEKQTATALANETTSLAAFSGLALERDRSVDAVQLALTAWPRAGDKKRAQTRRAIMSLSSALLQQRERMRFNGHGQFVHSAAFSPDGTRVVTASNDNTARVWDAATGAGLAELKGHGGIVNSAAFSTDGTRVVTASNDNARVWDISALETGEAFALACVRLGNNIDLKDLVKRHGLAELKPICGDHAPLPVDWTKVLD